MGQIVLQGLVWLDTSGSSTAALLIIVAMLVLMLGSRTLTNFVVRLLSAHHRGLVAYHNSRRRHVKGQQPASARKEGSSLAAAH
jgi:hypothetical protein